MSQYLVGIATGDGYGLGLQTWDGVFALNVDLETLLQTPLKNLPGLLSRATGGRVTGDPLPLRVPDVCEVWGAGVTYRGSTAARERASGGRDIYTHAYNAERPELFHKAVGADVVGDGDVVGIRHDAVRSVPEPELTMVLNSQLQVLGFTVGNDMSAVDIEGANPLYMPQAKTYYGACALGPRILLNPGAADYPAAAVHLTVQRGGAEVFSGHTQTRELHRPLPVLVDYLGRCKPFRNGVFLMTGTGVILPDDFTLRSGDTVTIKIEGIGTLTNPVRTVERLI